MKKERDAARSKGGEINGQSEADLEELRAKVDSMTKRMDMSVRKTIDEQQAIQDMEEALTSVQQNAASGRASQRTQQTSFDPTLPGATEGTPAGTQLGPGPSEVFNQRVHAKRESYETLALHTRYAEHNDYVGFKRSVHDGTYPQGEEPLPVASKWFREGRGSPAPGTAAAEEGSDSDDDIAIAREKISTKCPLTLQEFVDPVTSTNCPHSFERAAILELIKGAGRGTSTQCPVPGCTTVCSFLFSSFVPVLWLLSPFPMVPIHASIALTTSPQQITAKSLAQDPVLLRKIRRIQKSRNAVRDDPDSDMDDAGAPRGRNADTSILLDASSVAGVDDFDDMDDDDDEDVPETIQAKVEPTSARFQSHPPPSSRAVMVDLGTDEDEFSTEDEYTEV